MTVIRQKWIMRSDLQNNPNILYLFGDNDRRCGLGGQAKEMRGEPNSVGVRTKELPSMYENSFWSDETYWNNAHRINQDLVRVETHLRNGGIVVIPTDGLGTGLSELPTRAPQTFLYLEARLANLGK